MKLEGSGFVEVEDAELAYTVIGEGPPLVILHGGPGLGHDYLRIALAPLLSDSYQLIFYDQRGSGHSTGVEDTTRLTMATFVEDLESIRRKAGLERMNLLGHSFGGLLAMHYGITYPERVASLILADSDPASWEMWIWYVRVIDERRTVEDEHELAEIQAFEGWASNPKAMEEYFRIALRPYFADRWRADDLRLGLDEQVLANYGPTNRRVREDLGQYDIHDELERITSPALIVYGDQSIFPLEAGEALNERIPNSEFVVVEGAGHFPFIEAPEEFASAIKAFVPTG